MNIKLIGQASVLIECANRIIWTDPWLFGTAFNNSWKLMPEAQFTEDEYERITDLWISHEHPDHFHIPTLRSMPEHFKKNVTIWFQENNSNKVPDALYKMGFVKIRRMPHRKWVIVEPGIEMYCAQIGQMDSSLAVRSCGKTILNLNDCEVDTDTCNWIRGDLGKIDVVLNQFSIAGYSGEEDREHHLTSLASQILKNVVKNHKDLKAEVTIPFASYVYFCQKDNFYVNQYANTPHDVKKEMDKAGCKLLVLYPGDVWTLDQSHDSSLALRKYAQQYNSMEQWFIESPEQVDLDTIGDAFQMRAQDLAEKYPTLLLHLLRPVVCQIPDLQCTIRFHIASKQWTLLESCDAVDVVINSQPLYFMFKWPWGLQTLGVSARLILKNNESNWRKHRVLFSMNNAEVYLRPRLLFTKKNLFWFKQRIPKGLSQLRYQVKRMRPG